MTFLHLFVFILIFGRTIGNEEQKEEEEEDKVEEFTPTYNYCDPHLCHKSKHVACNHDMKFGPNCSIDARIVPLRKKNIDIILETHNLHRNTIAHGGFNGFGPATRMATMQWDDELAYLASLTARQCSMSHDDCRNTKRFHISGQNLVYKGYLGKAPSMNEIIKSQIRLWFAESKHMTMENIIIFGTHKTNNSVNNFAQLVQEKANYVGCAVLNQNRNEWLQQYLVCNYAHGNQVGTPVYSAGVRPAADCKTGHNPSYPNLCTINEVYSTNQKDSDADKAGNARQSKDDDSSTELTTKLQPIKSTSKVSTRSPPAEKSKKHGGNQASPFDNFLQQIGEHIDKVDVLDLSVNTYGHNHRSEDEVKFDNRDRKSSSKKTKKGEKKQKEKVTKKKNDEDSNE